MVLVKKADATWRFCINYRYLNDITIFDCEPMSTIVDSLCKFVNDVYFTELDLTKGYWQITLSERSNLYTVFATPKG